MPAHGTFATDTWINNAPISSTTPAGTVRTEALILFLQPQFDGGSAHFDNVSFTHNNAPAAYPGTDEDLILSTGIGGSPLSSGPTNDVKTAQGGDLIEVNVASPGGTFDLMGYWLVGEIFSTGTPPVPSPVFPELWFGPSTYFLLVVGLPTPIGPPVIRPNGGSSTYLMAPQGLPGVSAMLQGMVVANTVANGVYAATDAHEIQFQ